MLQDYAQAKPDDIALDDLTQKRTWAELSDRVNRIARLLHEDLGAAPGEHVAILMQNRVESIELLWGAIYAGLWVTPINWHLAPQEIDYLLTDSGAKVLFTEARYGSVAGRARCRTVVLGDEFEAALAGASDAPMPMDGPAGGNMIYTSGTTGQPKGVKRWQPDTLEAWLQRGKASGAGLGLDGSGPHLGTGPLYHAAPLMFAVYDQANGANIVIMPSFNEEEFLNLAAERRVHHTHLVPTMFVRLLRLSEEERAAFDGSSLQIVLHGAAPISRPVKERMIDWWGEVLFEYWGGTEGGVNTFIDSADSLLHPGSVGRALPGFEVFATDAAGRRLPAGEEGQLYCRNQKIDHPFEYHGDPAKTAKAFLAPGVFTLGDVGKVDAEGYVILSDRISNMIISGGVNIYPAEIENVLLEHPAIHDVWVFGIPNDEWGESVKAAVELRRGFEPSPELERAILDFAGEHLARYKVPRSVDFEVQLPRYDSGKLYVRLLRERYWKGRERQI